MSISIEIVWIWLICVILYQVNTGFWGSGWVGSDQVVCGWEVLGQVRSGKVGLGWCGIRSVGIGLGQVDSVLINSGNVKPGLSMFYHFILFHIWFQSKKYYRHQIGKCMLANL